MKTIRCRVSRPVPKSRSSKACTSCRKVPVTTPGRGQPVGQRHDPARKPGRRQAVAGTPTGASRPTSGVARASTSWRATDRMRNVGICCTPPRGAACLSSRSSSVASAGRWCVDRLHQELRRADSGLHAPEEGRGALYHGAAAPTASGAATFAAAARAFRD